MHIDWQNVWNGITSPEEGFKALWWELIIVLLIMPFSLRLYKWIKQFKGTVIRWILIISVFAVSVLAISYLLAQIIWQTSAHIGSETSKALRYQPQFRPCLRGEDVVNVDPRNNLLVVWLDVFNAGSPSVIKDWNLTGHGHDKLPFTSIFYITQPDPFIVTNINGKPLILRKDSEIWLETAFDPIPSGGMRGGYALFIFTNIDTKFLELPQNEFEFSFRDANDNLYVTNFSWPMPTR